MANTKKYVSLDKLSLYDEKIKGVIAAGDEAALVAAKAYADGLAPNYDAAGSATSALNSAKSYVDGEIVTVNNTIAGVKTIAENGVANAATAQAAAEAAQGAADKAQGDVDGLKTYVGTIPTTATATDIVGYVQEKTAGIATDTALEELTGRVAQAEKDVDAIEADYLKAADKTALSNLITAAQTAADNAQADIDAFELAYADDKAALEAEDARIVGLVEAEAERAAGVESGLKGRIETMEAFWASAKADGDEGNVIDTLKEIQEYIVSDETGASGMLASIQQNAKAIEDMDAAYKLADGTLQTNINNLSAVVDTKAATSVVEALDGRVGTAEGDIDALEGRMDTAEADIDALQALFGEGDGSVADMIADAVAAEAALRASGDTDVAAAAAADATSKANAAEAAAKAEAVRLDGLMNTRVLALEAIDHDHSNKAELDLIASGDKAKWDDAYAKRHEHENKSVLDGITAAKVTAWDGAEAAAKAHADNLNTAMNTRVASLETWHENFVECSQEDINALFAVKA